MGNTPFFSRGSHREFVDALVPKEVIEDMIHAATYAPTSCNLQVYKFIYVDDPDLLAFMQKKVTGKVSWTKQLLVLLVNKDITSANKANYISA